MLVITRREKETVVIGDVEITIVRIRRNQVRIGIAAPTGTIITRKELLTDKQPKKKVASINAI